MTFADVDAEYSGGTWGDHVSNFECSCWGESCVVKYSIPLFNRSANQDYLIGGVWLYIWCTPPVKYAWLVDVHFIFYLIHQSSILDWRMCHFILNLICQSSVLDWRIVVYVGHLHPFLFYSSGGGLTPWVSIFVSIWKAPTRPRIFLHRVFAPYAQMQKIYSTIQKKPQVTYVFLTLFLSSSLTQILFIYLFI